MIIIYKWNVNSLTVTIINIYFKTLFFLSHDIIFKLRNNNKCFRSSCSKFYIYLIMFPFHRERLPFVYREYDREIYLHSHLNLHVIPQMGYGPWSHSVYYEPNCGCFWCQCFGTQREGQPGEEGMHFKRQQGTSTSTVLHLGSEWWGCSLCINIPPHSPHSETFPFPLLSIN